MSAPPLTVPRSQITLSCVVNPWVTLYELHGHYPDLDMLDTFMCSEGKAWQVLTVENSVKRVVRPYK